MTQHLLICVLSYPISRTYNNGKSVTPGLGSQKTLAKFPNLVLFFTYSNHGPVKYCTQANKCHHFVFILCIFVSFLLILVSFFCFHNLCCAEINFLCSCFFFLSHICCNIQLNIDFTVFFLLWLIKMDLDVQTFHPNQHSNVMFVFHVVTVSYCANRMFLDSILLLFAYVSYPAVFFLFALMSSFYHTFQFKLFLIKTGFKLTAEFVAIRHTTTRW